ncbi:MAG: hypothetical protein ACXADC_12960 [Candidatus Thorarchaeota archaeon]|jgi:hypothetical protein
MRVIDVHVPDFDDLLRWVNELPYKIGSIWSGWSLSVHTSFGDPHWYYVYRAGWEHYAVIIMHLDYDEGKQMCRISIQSNFEKFEQEGVEYWEKFDWQLIDHNPPLMPPPLPPPQKPIKWSDLIPCPHCDARYNYPQSLADSGEVAECSNCGKPFVL